MRVLYITIPFYEYTEKICKAIERQLNAKVDVLNLQIQSTGLNYVVNKLSGGKYDQSLNNRIQESFYEEKKNVDYDYIFVLVGRGLNAHAFSEFCKIQKKAKKILYLWDDVKRVESFEKIYHLFDEIFSFDKKDCINYNFKFLPLFYCNEYRYEGEEKCYDISTTGSLHSDRVNVIDNIMKIFPEDKFKWYVLLMTSRMHMLKERLVKKNIEKELCFVGYKMLTMKENADILKKSKVVIDIPHASQNGLSIRTFEALASETKMITTNAAVKEYDFFDERNICIIDRKNPVVEKAFVEDGFCKLDSVQIEKYSIDSWVKNMFKE